MNPIAHARHWLQPLHAVLLAALLLAAQGLGLAHHVAHGGAAQAHAGVHTQSHGPAAPWLDGHDEGSDNCRLIDQLGHADLALGSLAQAPVVPAVQTAPAQRAAAAPHTALVLAYSAGAPPPAARLRA